MTENEHDRPGEAGTTVRTGFFSDPMVRIMGWVALGLVALYVATIVSALYLGILGGKEQYRTAPERHVGVAAARFEADPTEDTVLSYTTALIAVERYRTAQTVIDRTIDTVDQEVKGAIFASQANLHFARKDYDAAIASAEEARATGRKHYDTLVAEGGAAGSAAALPDTYWSMIILQAKASQELGDDTRALAYFDEYLEAKPAAADVYVARGDLKVALGDRDGAEADFRSALRFVPAYPEAILGLNTIGATQ